MKDFLKKFTSRKFLLALISVVSGVLTMANCNDNLIQFICSLIMIIVPSITYIITEGVLDYTGIGLALQDIIEAINKYIGKDEDTEEENNPEEDVTTELQEGTIEISEDGIAL